jgi:hypothetical protein
MILAAKNVDPDFNVGAVLLLTDWRLQKVESSFHRAIGFRL